MALAQHPSLGTGFEHAERVRRASAPEEARRIDAIELVGVARFLVDEFHRGGPSADRAVEVVRDWAGGDELLIARARVEARHSLRRGGCELGVVTLLDDAAARATAE